MDTISFRINLTPSIHILNKAQFVPDFSSRKFASLSQKELKRAANPQTRYLRHFVLRPDIISNLCFPKVDLYERVNMTTNEIEYEGVIMLSIPKLMFENNLQEITSADKNRVFGTISDRLYQIGIQVSEVTIATAPLSVVHFCKNIFLPKEMSLRSILSELGKVDMGKSYDTTNILHHKDKNNSKVVHFYCKTRDWVFYDKIEDLQRTKSRRIDKQRTEYEKEISTLFCLEDTEVFRFEYRLNKAQTISSEINPLLGRDYKERVTFADVFSDELWRNVLNNSWKRMLDRPENQLALLDTNNSLSLFLHMLDEACKKDNGAHSQNKALISFGLAVAIKENGAKTVRQEIEKRWLAKAGERINEKLYTAVSLLNDVPLSQGIVYIGEKLNQFTSISKDFLTKNASKSP
jgi:hypothetical protein